MDVVGLLGAVLALAIYPSGLTLLVLSLVAHRAAGLPGPRESGWSRAALLAAATATLAAALLPLPGSPARSLPPESGPAANLFALVLLVAVGAGALPGGIWPGRGLAAAGVAVVALVSLAAPAGSLSLEVVAGFPGAPYAVARSAVAVAVVGVGVLLSRGRRRPQEEGGRVALVVACDLAAVYLLAGASLSRLPGALAIGLVMAGTVACAGACLRWGRRLPGGVCEGATALAAGLGLVATLVAAR